MGMYISSDPIGLAGDNPTLYGYVEDVNTWFDAFGLAVQMVNGVPMGAWGEKVAAKYLKKHGHTILGSIQNSSGHGFDLITKTKDGNIHIIEVKTSQSKPAGKANMADWANRNIEKISQNTNGRWGNMPQYQKNLINIIREAKAKKTLQYELVQINIDKRSIKITCKNA